MPQACRAPDVNGDASLRAHLCDKNLSTYAPTAGGTSRFGTDAGTQVVGTDLRVPASADRMRVKCQG